MDDYLVDIAVYANRTQTFRTEKSSWRAPASSTNRPQSELMDAMATAPSHWVYSVSSLANIFKVFESSGWVHQSVVMPFLQQSLENQDLTPHQKSILIDAITESCLVPKLNPQDGTVKFKFNDSINSVLAFSKHLAGVLDKRTSGPHDPIHSYATSPQMPLQASDKMRLRAQPYVSQGGKSESYKHSDKKSHGENDLTNFLAQIRKIGMDILFPQNIHDKVLICIFVALRKNKCLAHRELIDLVILVNSQTHYGSTDTVTKTKVRGVLALLKHANILVTQAPDGTPVKLEMVPTIDSFFTLREVHDNYLTSVIANNGPFKFHQWTDVLWDMSNEVQKRRREEWIDKFIHRVEAIYENKDQSQQEITPPNSARNSFCSDATTRDGGSIAGSTSWDGEGFHRDSMASSRSSSMMSLDGELSEGSVHRVGSLEIISPNTPPPMGSHMSHGFHSSNLFTACTSIQRQQHLSPGPHGYVMQPPMMGQTRHTSFPAGVRPPHLYERSSYGSDFDDATMRQGCQTGPVRMPRPQQQLYPLHRLHRVFPPVDEYIPMYHPPSANFPAPSSAPYQVPPLRPTTFAQQAMASAKVTQEKEADGKLEGVNNPPVHHSPVEWLPPDESVPEQMRRPFEQHSPNAEMSSEFRGDALSWENDNGFSLFALPEYSSHDSGELSLSERKEENEKKREEEKYDLFFSRSVQSFTQMPQNRSSPTL